MRRGDSGAMEVIRAQAQSNEVTVILVQDAADADLELQELKGQVFALAEDTKNKKGNLHPQIGYEEMLGYILDSDTVVTW